MRRQLTLVSRMGKSHKINAQLWLDRRASVYAHLYAKQRPADAPVEPNDHERTARPKSWIRRTTLYQALGRGIDG